MLVVYIIFLISGGYAKKENVPIVFPTLHARGVLLLPFLLQTHQRFQRGFLSQSGVNQFQIGYESLDVRVRHVPSAGPYLVNDAALDVRFGVSDVDCLPKARQPVYTKQIPFAVE